MRQQALISLIPRLNYREMHGFLGFAMTIADSTDNDKEVLRDSVVKFQDVGCRISGKDILRKITLNVRRGEIIGLLGKNGAGKTTASLIDIGVAEPLLRRNLCSRRKDAFSCAWFSYENGFCSPG